jgi:hypothetical protein
MLDTDIEDSYTVEHDENYVMTSEQLRRLIWEKFERNNVLHQLEGKREALCGDR